MKYEIVSADKADEIRRKADYGPRVTDEVIALLDGKMLHFDCPANRAGISPRPFEARGMRKRTRSDGNGGCFIWAERVDA